MKNVDEEELIMHELEFDHGHMTPEQQQAVADVIWAADNVELKTVGVDIGSSTSHLMFSRVHLQRLTTALSSRFVVVGREVLWRSPILLTPYKLDDNTIDVGKLSAFIDGAYKEAGLSRDDIDSGAVILTGEALKRNNAEAITHLFAGETGKFVTASAGHHLECAMAANGSGAVALSRAREGLHPQYRHRRRHHQARPRRKGPVAADHRLRSRRPSHRLRRRRPHGPHRRPGDQACRASRHLPEEGREADRRREKPKSAT